MMPPPIPEVGDYDSAFSTGPGQSVPSLVQLSDSDLYPRDSISNQGSSVSGDGHDTPSQPLLRWTDSHDGDMDVEFYDPQYHTWRMVFETRARLKCKCSTEEVHLLIVLCIRYLQTQAVCSHITPKRREIREVMMTEAKTPVTKLTMTISSSLSLHDGIVTVRVTGALLMTTGIMII